MVRTPRERIIERMVDDLMGYFGPSATVDCYTIADICLRVIESPPDPTEKSARICNCGQSGYPENSPYSNHPHAKTCPQYTGHPDAK